MSESTPAAPSAAPSVAAAAAALQAGLGEELFGLERAILLAFCAALCRGHVLIEAVPGTGKTTLAKALARDLGLSFSRLQFTPDLLPSDVTGLYWFDQKAGDFRFRAGPIFSQILLADEINRATPRTQSALLEAMAEGQVSLEGQRHALPDPFLVIATQNPVETEGTFPLPEAQLDRFLMRIQLDYPDMSAEDAILRRHADPAAPPPASARPGLLDLLALREHIATIHLGPELRDYLLRLVRATRAHPEIELGASSRAALHLHRAAQALAATQGRAFVLPDDIQSLAQPVLAHRLRLSPESSVRGRGVETILAEIIAATPVPVEG